MTVYTTDYAALVRRGVVQVSEDEQGVSGFVVVILGDGARLDNVAVSARARGQGIGRMLIARAETMARDAGYGSIALYANEAMTENFVLYPRLGYRESHRGTEQGLHRVYCSKTLSP